VLVAPVSGQQQPHLLAYCALSTVMHVMVNSLSLWTHSECITAMRQLRRVDDVSREFNEVYRGLTSDAKLGHEWSDLFMTKTILLRLVRNVL
jgi:hypothetical protein